MQVDAAAAGMSARALARITDHFMQRYIEPGKIAGALPVVYRKGALAYFEPLGRMDVERNKPMRDDTIFRIYSMTKPITAVALMMLYEDGLFQLNDPVHRVHSAVARSRRVPGRRSCRTSSRVRSSAR